MSYRAAATMPATELAVLAWSANLDLSQVPDPQPGWVTANPDRSLAFFFLSPRPGDAFEELMQLT